MRLLDLGSCTNYFASEHGHRFDALALDLAPAHPSVFKCDVLDLQIHTASDGAILPGGGDSGNAGTLTCLPAASFSVVVAALLLSYIPRAEARALVVAKARQLLPVDGSGLLIIADTTAALVGATRGEAAVSANRNWIAAVESAGFRLLPDPQMHFTRARDRRTGVVNRAICFSFATVPQRSGNEFPQRPIYFESESTD